MTYYKCHDGLANHIAKKQPTRVLISRVPSYIGMGDKLSTCTDTIGDLYPETSRSEGTGQFYHYLESWNGELLYPEGPSYTDPSGDTFVCEGSTNSACAEKTCGWGSTVVRYALETNSTSGRLDFINPEDMEFCIESGRNSSEYYNATMDCDRCTSTCDMRCPLPVIYTDAQYSLMWVLGWLPGFIAFPLSLLVIVSERKRILKLKRRDITDWVTSMSAVICVLLFFLDALPSAILAENLRCNGHDTMNFRVNTYAHDFCEVGKIKPHLMQALLICVAITLYKVLRQLRASSHMSRYAPSRLFRIMVPCLVVGVPGLLSIGTFVLEADQLYMSSYLYRESQGGETAEETMYYPNLIRYAYSCGPLFGSPEEEVLFVQGPLLVIGAISVIFSFYLLGIVAKMSGLRLSSHKSAGPSSGKSKSRGGSGPSSVVYRLAVNMIRFAFVSTMLVILNAVSTALFLPKAMEFGKNVDVWFRCARTGVRYQGEDTTLWSTEGEITVEFLEQDDICGPLGEPPFGLILLQVVTMSFPPFSFGFIFAIPALKQLKIIKSRRVWHKVTATSANTSEIKSAPTKALSAASSAQSEN
ncbi:Hypothetical Protein FCC1311_061282 [Hondaea fermentalgiana]|uniref:Uncharacterized protein n=1 Tax=Hondaea fermentalgiana TaxID=2315210 RepID=A0A2R5GJJ3_9STRA|nr:Hypothetical Protein FCC1311_061282 [Hondaea fermentalgiana]|eukprot:GBG29908.1 Hypothetical Protein FCC1311_061282 [Hondaea fermentalgiana]